MASALKLEAETSNISSRSSCLLRIMVQRNLFTVFYKVFFFIVLTTTLASCIEHEVIPPVPTIRGIQFIETGQNAKMIIDFTDGDGNFGLEQSDTLGQFRECRNAFNLFAEYYEMQNGKWVQIKIDPCDDPAPDPDVPYYYKIPWARPTGQDQTQQGLIEIQMNSWRIESDFDTVKFVVQIKDRDLQLSNVIEVLTK